MSEFYEKIGFPLTKESLSYGWIKEKADFIDILLIPEMGTSNILIFIVCYDIKDYFPEEGEAE